MASLSKKEYEKAKIYFEKIMKGDTEYTANLKILLPWCFPDDIFDPNMIQQELKHIEMHVKLNEITKKK